MVQVYILTTALPWTSNLKLEDQRVHCRVFQPSQPIPPLASTLTSPTRRRIARNTVHLRRKRTVNSRPVTISMVPSWQPPRQPQSKPNLLRLNTCIMCPLQTFIFGNELDMACAGVHNPRSGSRIRLSTTFTTFYYCNFEFGLDPPLSSLSESSTSFPRHHWKIRANIWTSLVLTRRHRKQCSDSSSCKTSSYKQTLFPKSCQTFMFRPRSHLDETTTRSHH